MSGNVEEDKPESAKAFPLDLAAKLTSAKTMDGKAPLLVTTQPLRNMRVLAQQSGTSSGQTSIVTPTIISTSIVSQVLKQNDSRTHSVGLLSAAQTPSTSALTIQRPTQITLSASLPVVATTLPVVSQNTYHVPRGPAVVANLAPPRSNVVGSIRTPMVVTGQPNQQAFVRPSRAASPAQGTAWLTTSSSNGSQIKGAPTVLSPPVRGATVSGTLGKPQLLTRTQPVPQPSSTIRPATATILHSAITIGQGAQLHPFKPSQGGTGNAVTIAQVIPSRTQTLVYSSNGTQFTSTPRLTVGNTVQNQRPISTSKAQMSTARLTMPISVSQGGTTRLVAPQGTVLTTGARISTISTSQSSTTPRVVSTSQSTVTLSRLSVSVATAPTQANSVNVLGQTRISTLSLHPLVAVASNSQPRTIQTQGAKVINQPVPGNTLHIPQMSAVLKSAPPTSSARTINVQQSNLVSQRPITTGSTQTVAISKVLSQPIEDQSSQTAANIFIHTPLTSVPRKSSPGLTTVSQTAATSTALPTYSLSSGAYFYDASGTYSVTRPFNQQSSFAAVPQTNNQIRAATLTSQVHGVMTNQPMRFNPVMVFDQNRISQFAQQQSEITQEQHQAPTTKITSSPRPSILRKRDHEGSPLKAAKNLAPQLGILPIQNQAPISPPSRPDSGGNCNSSGGSTTISATSSPGLAETNEDSMSHIPMNIKEEENTRPPTEMSPRKKPRKQQLTGNDLDEHLHDDMQFISETNVKREPESDSNRSDITKDESSESRRVLRKPASASLLNSYRQTWKATHNHYLRYADVKPKDERRPTIMDLSNQYRVLDKVNGWKVHHLSTQMEDLADQEQNVYNQLKDLLKDTEAEEGNGFDKEVNRINELIKGNLQRIKIINDGMIEAKTQIMKIFDHKIHVTDIISRCASKRNFKKREKS
ncbi:hypothetical protein FQR65_LT08390 [Abscondita terminalis]|nr:hypothetical protein FQR65_LT08390 [Abscondita terminalis]